MTTISRELVLAKDPRKRWRVELDGDEVIQSTWTVGKAPKTERERVDDAWDAFDELIARKLSGGYVFLREQGSAAPGEIVVELSLPKGAHPHIFDLHPAGNVAAFGTTDHGAEPAAALHVLDLATGMSRRALELPGAPVGLDSVAFDAGGDRLLYTAHGETRRVDLESGATETLARAGDHFRRETRFNPSLLRPSASADRRRWMVFDARETVRVLDAADETLFERSFAGTERVLQAAALSPSGRFAVLYAKEPLPGGRERRQCEVVEIATAQVRHTVRFDESPAGPVTVGLDPEDEHLLVAVDDGRLGGPLAIALATGERAWHLPGPERYTPPPEWGWGSSFGYSPDGRYLAVIGTTGIQLYDAVTRAPIAIEHRSYQAIGGGTCATEIQTLVRAVFSADGARLALAGTGRYVVVRAL